MLINLGNFHCSFQQWHPSMGRVFTSQLAFDIETPRIVGHEIPAYVLGAATDGDKGFFVLPKHVHAFFLTHWECQCIFHNAAFDLAALNAFLKAHGKTMDVYDLVDQHRVWDTLLLHKLYGLSTVGHTYQGKGQSTLEKCIQMYMGVSLPKDIRDQNGDEVRMSWGKWQDRPPKEIDPIYLEYLAKDVLGTFGCFTVILPKMLSILETSHVAFGYVNSDWLEKQWSRFGPQTHDLQVKAAVVLEEIERNGFGLDLANRGEILVKAQELHESLREELRQGGYLVGEKGCEKALQAIIRKAAQENPEIEISRTETGKYSTTEESLDHLAELSEFFAALKEFRQVRTLLNNYLAKMDQTRIHPHYDILKVSGRTGSSNPNIQGFPKKSKKKGKLRFDIRRCFVPAEGKLFYVADYKTIELCLLCQALITQFRQHSEMAKAINAGKDVHRLVAARMKATGLPNSAEVLANPTKLAAVASSLSDDERGGAKPANFGLPTGMGVKTLKAYARAQYDQPYSDADAQAWLDAWLASFPEMVKFREDDSDFGLILAERLQLTPSNYSAATGEPNYADAFEEQLPAAYLGLMAYKVVKDSIPKKKKNGDAYSQAVVDFFWDRLQLLSSDLDPKMRQALIQRQPSPALGFAVKRLVDKGSVFVITGRLRASASYSARRNTIFQGAASDGAKLALYRLWRAGFKVVAFIHDEVIIEVDANADLSAIRLQIDEMLKNAMKEICPDIAVEVEGCFRRRWGKDKTDEVALPKPEETPSENDTHFTQKPEIINGNATTAA